ncbi:MAG: DUF4114 domain-containing protein [Phycisphaerae bacterium]
MKSIRNTLRLTACGIFGLAITSTASADFSLVQDSGEPNHFDILEGIYSPGTPWTTFGSRTDGEGDLVDLTNGTLSAVRVDDYGVEGIMNISTGNPGDADDRLWTGSLIDSHARARFAGYQQQFGMGFEAGEWIDVLNLFTVSGSGLAVSGSATMSLAEPTDWVWVRGGDGDQYTSEPFFNGDQDDHMVTYQIRGFDDGLTHWVLFWEDLPNLGDVDYNDLVVEIAGPAVPEPASMGLMSLGMLALLKRRA